jgi:hypothetical protein
MTTGISIQISLVASVSAFLGLSTGCAPAPQIDIGSIEREGTLSNGFTLNGFTLNGFTLNGVQLNGFTLNGFTLNGVQLNGVQLNGFTLNGFTLNGTQFSASTGSGQSVSGLDLVGAEALLSVQPSGQSQPTEYRLRFDSIYGDPTRPGGDVFLYDVSVAAAGSSTWKSLCTDSSGGPVPAIPIRNYWDPQSGARIDNPNAITFACTSGALGKCVRLGYRPWAQATRCKNGACATVSLADHHQACTRMIRADYCGNGTSYTLNGTLIEVYDELSPQVQANTMGWSVEAHWSPSGAACLSSARHAALLAQGRYPDCDGNGYPGDLPSCGSNTNLQQTLLGSTWDAGQ